MTKALAEKVCDHYMVHQIYWLWKKGYIKWTKDRLLVLWEKLGIDPTTTKMPATLDL